MAKQLHDEKTPDGLPITKEAFERLIETESPYRYELIDGKAVDMTGSMPEHGQLAGNCYLLFREQLQRGGPCHVHQDQYVEIPGGHAPVVPDMVLTCDLADWDKDKRLKPFRIQSPLVVVEVLSPSTEKYDRGEKFLRYRCCSTLQVYILVKQDEPLVEVFRRAKQWKPERFGVGQIIQLDELDLELAVDMIYEGVF